MEFTRTSIALAAIVACRGFLAQATPQPEQSQIDSADRLFQAGKFPEAEKLYSTNRCSKSEGLFGNRPVRSHCVAFQSA
jgi:hypothetical protein